MTHQLFLSHDSRDRGRADVLAHMIKRISLRQIDVWHSSDQSQGGGLMPGHVWLDEIRRRLTGSRAVVALITPTSISRPWLLFESGFGAAQHGCDVIPVCIGVDRLADIPFPLAMYQAYQLSDYEALKRFAEKLTSRYDVAFDEQMSRSVLLEALTKLTQDGAGGSENAEAPKEMTLSEATVSIKEHIDKRIVSLMSAETASTKSKASGYTVPINLPGKQKTQYVEVESDTTVSNILDRIYFMLDGKVTAYRYLEEWMLIESTSKVRMVIRELESQIPASIVFQPGTAWDVKMLTKPYSARDSREFYD